MVFTIIIAGVILVIATYHITKKSQKRYWQKIIQSQEIPLYWDAEPKCPYCGETQEAIFGLNDDGEWFSVICSNCEKTFGIKPYFEMNHEIKQESESLNPTDSK